MAYHWPWCCLQIGNAMLDKKPTLVDCVCNHCHKKFTIMSAIGESQICDACAKPLFDILGTAIDRSTIREFSVTGD